MSVQAICTNLMGKYSKKNFNFNFIAPKHISLPDRMEVNIIDFQNNAHALHTMATNSRFDN